MDKSERQKTLEALYFIKGYIGEYGIVTLAGSARRYKAFTRGHDFDVRLNTYIPSKELIIEKIEKLAYWWRCRYRLPIHVIVIGPFISEHIIKKTVYFEYRIHFTTPVRNIWLWATMISLKMIRFLFRQSKKQNESQ